MGGWSLWKLWLCMYIYIYIYTYIYIYIYMCVCACVCVCVYGYIKVWVSYSSLPWTELPVLKYIREFETGNLNLLFYCHNCFFWILSQNRSGYFKNNCSSNLAGVYPEGFQGHYTGLGTQLCMQLMKNS